MYAARDVIIWDYEECVRTYRLVPLACMPDLAGEQPPLWILMVRDTASKQHWFNP